MPTARPGPTPHAPRVVPISMASTCSRVYTPTGMEGIDALSQHHPSRDGDGEGGGGEHRFSKRFGRIQSSECIRPHPRADTVDRLYPPRPCQNAKHGRADTGGRLYPPLPGRSADTVGRLYPPPSLGGYSRPTVSAPFVSKMANTAGRIQSVDCIRPKPWADTVDRLYPPLCWRAAHSLNRCFASPAGSSELGPPCSSAPPVGPPIPLRPSCWDPPGPPGDINYTRIVRATCSDMGLWWGVCVVVRAPIHIRRSSRCDIFR